MRKIFFMFFMVSSVFVIFAQSGVISELSGDVQLKPAGASSFTAANSGDIVLQDTVVSTGFKSTAVITIGNSTITVRPLTRLSLSEISATSNTENLSVNLQTGRVKVDVKPPAGTKANMTVQSPSATASVRGTSFEFDTLNLNVIEGSVAFGGNFGITAIVQGGESSFVGVDGQPVSPVAVSTAALLPSAPAGIDKAVDVQASSTSSTVDMTVNVKYPNN